MNKKALRTNQQGLSICYIGLPSKAVRKSKRVQVQTCPMRHIVPNLSYLSNYLANQFAIDVFLALKLGGKKKPYRCTTALDNSYG